jgi:CRISPR system Cascade subunit CasD
MKPAEYLVLEFEALPWMSFGGATVDHIGVTRLFPAASMLTGLLGAALGYGHADHGKLQDLQNRLHFASRLEREGSTVEDFQTVSFGQPMFQGTGWTTRGRIEERAGGPGSRFGTHIRRRFYRADSAVLVALTLKDGEETPKIRDLERALTDPIHTLFLGRRACLPARRLLRCVRTAKNLLEVLKTEPLIRGVTPVEVLAQWPAEERDEGELSRLADLKEWRNDTHVGDRVVKTGTIVVSGGACD